MADTTFWDTLWRDSLAAPIAGPEDVAWENEIDRRKMRYLAPRLPDSGTAIEVGCGSARLLARVGRSRGLRLIAVDESATALAVAARTGRAFEVPLHLVQGTTLALPLADGSADVVLSGGLLEHFAEPTPVLHEMVRVLRPGGLLYADVVPRKRSWYRAHEAERMRTSPFMEEGVYESDLGPAAYVERLRTLGCGAIQYRWSGVYPWRLQHHARMRRLVSRFTELLDGSAVAERWGWYFMLTAVKR